MKINSIFILVIFTLSCKTARKSPDNGLSKTNSKILISNFNSKFDSLNNSKVAILENSEFLKLSEEAHSRNYVYEYDYSEKPLSDFSVDNIFLPFHLGLINEKELFVILNNIAKTNREIFYYLQKYPIPSLKDKARLIDYVKKNANNKERLETVSIITATQFHEDKRLLKELIDSLSTIDESNFAQGKFGKVNLIDKIAYRYAYNHIDDYIVNIVDRVIVGQREGDKHALFAPADFHPDPLYDFLFGELKYCENAFSYVYENSNKNIKQQLDKGRSRQESYCKFKEGSFEQIDKIISSAHKHGLTSFDLTTTHKLFLRNQKEEYGGEVPKLKIIYYSNLGIPFSELNGSLDPAPQLTALIYKNLLSVYIQGVDFKYYDHILHMIIEDTNLNKYAFDISKIENVWSPQNELTNIFNYILYKQSVKKRIVSLSSQGLECLLIGEPLKIKNFALENEIELSNI